ncbi:MAG: rplU [Phenylobacterium sp.]|nr:rplU [Phenylobacterium sp.]MDB5495703.1 rplU [Phenylobacterium sp.]
MYAVIKTGGKQYRVQPGDLLVVEKLDGEPGAKIAFADVLMLGEGEAVTVGAPLVEGAKVQATLIETRKGEKIKIFKKIRRKGYRRTGGHRQLQSVLRVTSIAGAGQEAKWDGEVKLITKAELDARARGLTFVSPAAQLEAAAAAKAPKTAGAAKKVAAPKKTKTAEEVVASPEVKDAMAAAEVNAPVAEAPAKQKAPAKKTAAPKAEAKAATEKKPAAKKAPAAKKKD